MQLVFRGLSGLRRFRRSTLGYAHEHEMIERWLEKVLTSGDKRRAGHCKLGGMVKGYGDTRYRTTSRLMTILDYLDTAPDADAGTIAALHAAAMAPDSPFESAGDGIGGVSGLSQNDKATPGAFCPGRHVSITLALAAAYRCPSIWCPRYADGLALGLSCHFLSESDRFIRGLVWASGPCLRFGVALLGLRLSLG
ncbi:MAG: hypothetical protein CM15mP125_1150 [Gammaproteobacteria bacterium]|nr:MAG: hypothetical protein CM15mP125_1150 [Gammaproteobacteria bacterium]